MILSSILSSPSDVATCCCCTSNVFDMDVQTRGQILLLYPAGVPAQARAMLAMRLKDLLPQVRPRFTGDALSFTAKLGQ